MVSRIAGKVNRLAFPAFQKAESSAFILCGLSPPVSPRREMVSQYTFWPALLDSS